jgi:hypothetical protein
MSALAAVVVLELTTVVVLARLGSRPPFTITWDAPAGWMRAADPVDAVAALVRLVALVAAGWLLAITLACALVDLAGPRSSPEHGVRARVHAATPRAIRRVVDRALLLAVIGLATAPTGAWATSPPGVRDGRAAPPDVPASAPTVLPAAPPTAPVGTGATRVLPAATAGPSDATTVAVAPGDDLWRLAAARLAQATGRSRAALSDAEVARYWVVVCEANRTVVRSGDVDLVFPGEVLVLPAVPSTTPAA